MSRVLHEHDEIRLWAAARGGSPMTMDVPDGGGDTRTLLQLTFGQHALNAENNEGPDRPTGGYALVGWDDWFAEFDKQGMGIKVNNDQPGILDNDFEFIAGDGKDSPAAQKPAAISVEDPNAQTEFAGRGR